MVSLMTEWRGIAVRAGPRTFAVASEVPPNNKAAATAIRADFDIPFLQAALSRPRFPVLDDNRVHYTANKLLLALVPPFTLLHRKDTASIHVRKWHLADLLATLSEIPAFRRRALRRGLAVAIRWQFAMWLASENY
jgi:hypothetical protein